ncbi:MAG: hypothetical protein ACLFWM_00825 [Actinomycetota bacterium]
MTTRDTTPGTEVGSVRRRFGGIDTPAALMGMFTALGVVVFLGALIAAGGGAIEYQLNAFDAEGNAQELGIAGVAVAALVVLAAFVVGGAAAGRMARYDGGVNGLAAATWALLLIAVFAALGAFVGAEYNAFRQVGLPDWFSQLRLSSEEATTIGIVAAVVSIVLMYAGAYAGGRIGEGYHRRVDAALSGRRADHRRESVDPEAERI